MFYDLHIHTCLSPCADDDMTPNNIMNMSQLKGLDVIAITDHNSTKQIPAFHALSKNSSLKVLYGVEVETQEEVHVLCIFKNVEDNQHFQLWIDQHFLSIPNDVHYFGNEYILNDKDERIGQEKNLLITSLQVSLEDCVREAHKQNGVVILAHVLDRKNSIMHQLGFIPKNLSFDGIEIKNEEEKEKVISMHPWLKDTYWFIDSDAHRLIDISESIHSMSNDTFNALWGD